MMKDILIKINSKTSQVILPTDVIGINRENLQGNLIFEFEDNFIDGTARLELNKNKEKTFVMAAKDGDKYIIPILSSLLDCKQIDMQLVITENENDTGIPIFKSRVFFLKVLESINAEQEEPEQYPTWIELANAKLNDIDEKIEEVENLDIEAERVTDGVNVKITNKEGTTTTTKVNDGTNGQDGKSIEYNWNGTKLGIKQEGQADYEYVDLKGDTGPEGTQGERGFQGPQGEKGDKGDKGEQGIQGQNGQDGYTPVKGTDYFTQEEIQQIESNILDKVNQFSIQVVQELPTENIDDHTIYFVLKTNTEQNDVYDEYIYVNNDWEHIGTTAVDLTGYVKDTDYATGNKAGVIKQNNWFNISEDGKPYANSSTYEDYQTANDYVFIGKRTLENVITGKDLATKQDIKDYVDSLNANSIEY